MKTHRLRNDDSPALVVVRDGRDAITSYAHLRASVTAGSGDPAGYRAAFEQEAMAQIIRSDSGTGSWGRNVLSWTGGVHPRREIVRFEDLIAQPSVAIAAAARLAPDVAFGHDPTIPAFADLHQRDPGFFRRGISGGHRDELPPHLVDRFWSIPEHRRAMQELGYS